ncbi:carboxypeptidase-like regulatory domain-containing protein [Bacteroidota bacterium]
MKPLLILIFLLTISFSIHAQVNEVTTGPYTEISFSEFVNEIEKTGKVLFFYKEEWVDHFVLRNVPAGTSLEDLLTEQLGSHDLNYYIQDKRVYIYKGPGIVSNLPDFKEFKKETISRESLTEEKNGSGAYLQTREILHIPLIQIGTRQNMVYGRRCRIKGTIVNQRDNEVLIGATMYINELELGVISDVNGEFEMSLPPGEYTMDVNHMAMKEMHYMLNVYSDGEFALELENEIIELQEVTISDDRLDNVKSLQMGQERISVKTMKEIPVVMGEKDVIKIAQMLPGVQNVGEGSSGFNVRGGAPDQNMFYINKISVYNTSHLFGFFTAFSPDIINDFTLYKNNIPTKYGGRIASVFEISTRTGNKDKFFAQGGISPITGHFSFEGPVVKGKVSVVGSFRSTYSDWLLKRLEEQNLKQSTASFQDGTFGINADINEKNKLRLFLYHSRDTFSFSSTNSYQYSNSGASLSWRHIFSPTLSSEMSFASSNYQFSTTDKTNISEAYYQTYSINHHELRADFLLLKFENHRIEFGAGSILYDLDRGRIDPFGPESTREPIALGQELGLENAVYISDEVKLSPNINVLGGLRISQYSLFGPEDVIEYIDNYPREIDYINGVTSYGKGKVIKSYAGLEPRLAVNYIIDNQRSVKASYNRLKQYIFLLSNTIAISPNDQWKLTDYYIRPPVADQISVGYYQALRNKGISMSLELYNKWVRHVVDYKNGVNFISGQPLEQQVVQGKQNAAGVEVMLRKTENKLTGWLSYTYSRSFITMNSLHASERINAGNPYPSNFDRPHSLNLVSNYRLSRRLSLSSNLVYATGRPITLPVAIYYAQGQQLLLYSERNQYRIPDYFRMDLSINLEGNLKFKKLGHSYWMFNVYNLAGRKNAYSVFYKIEEGELKGYKLSVFAQPIVTLSWHLKLGNYANE